MIVLVDIDHTLADSAWRDSMIGGPDGWDAYHAAATHDKPINAIVTLVNALAVMGHTVYAITARPEKWRELTMQWFLQNHVMINDVLMRKDNDYRPSPIVKLDNVKTRWRLEEIGLVIDDRDDVCATFRANGITTLQSFAAAAKRDESGDGPKENQP